MSFGLIGLCVVFVMMWISDLVTDTLSYKKEMARIRRESNNDNQCK